jgi:hypothetical protein
MKLRKLLLGVAASAASASAFFAVTGCSSNDGSANHPCTPANFPSGGDTCNTGLVCNTGEATPTCEQPNTHPVGEACGADDNCQTGLWCDRMACAKPLGLGDSCPSGLGCGPGLECTKSGATVCVAVDGGAGDAGGE